MKKLRKKISDKEIVKIYTIIYAFGKHANDFLFNLARTIVFSNPNDFDILKHSAIHFIKKYNLKNKLERMGFLNRKKP